ncbi:MAG: DUF488 domain-containing protein [Pseudomonadota bacterium]|nr:DUF488 domain-containing protein [Pseudomonadota bacterium]|tara:strand:+ start:329 stop:778 length:450 start_codon:yes stop_codon:yes gene_type:complete
MTVLYTIGYEGADISAFLSTLVEAGVRHVADIRDVPVSRKKGFSKNKLAEALSDSGITYSHFKALGDPKEGRDAMRSGDKKRFLAVFNAHIEKPESVRALSELADEATESDTVLLCYERDPQDCHRTIIASILQQEGRVEKITHLGVRK